MLSDSRVSAVLPVVDLNVQGNFMKKSLDFGLVMLLEELCLNVDKVHSWLLQHRDSPTKADHTAAGWEVDDVEKVVKDLREKGVVFEQYEMTDEQGIANMGGVKGAWFKDSEGNILSVVQFE